MEKKFGVHIIVNILPIKDVWHVNPGKKIPGKMVPWKKIAGKMVLWKIVRWKNGPRKNRGVSVEHRGVCGT